MLKELNKAQYRIAKTEAACGERLRGTEGREQGVVAAAPGNCAEVTATVESLLGATRETEVKWKSLRRNRYQSKVKLTAIVTMGRKKTSKTVPV